MGDKVEKSDSDPRSNMAGDNAAAQGELDHKAPIETVKPPAGVEKQEQSPDTDVNWPSNDSVIPAAPDHRKNHNQGVPPSEALSSPVSPSPTSGEQDDFLDSLIKDHNVQKQSFRGSEEASSDEMPAPEPPTLEPLSAAPPESSRDLASAASPMPVLPAPELQPGVPPVNPSPPPVPSPDRGSASSPREPLVSSDAELVSEGQGPKKSAPEEPAPSQGTDTKAEVPSANPRAMPAPAPHAEFPSEHEKIDLSGHETSPAHPDSEDSQHKGGALKWWLIILALVILGAVGYFFLVFNNPQDLASNPLGGNTSTAIQAGSALDETRRTDLTNLQKALEQYYAANKAYPTSATAASTEVTDSPLKVLVPQYLSSLPVDPAGASYDYQSADGTTYTLTATFDNSVSEGGIQSVAAAGGTGYVVTLTPGVTFGTSSTTTQTTSDTAATPSSQEALPGI